MMMYDRPRMTPAIKRILIATIAVYVLQILPGIGRLILGYGALVPAYTFSYGQIWRLVTYLFLHSSVSPFHLLFNMLALWMFGIEIEQRWGSRRFFIFYLLMGAASGLFNIVNLFSPQAQFIPVIGASGAILALLTVFAIYYPHRQILIFFLFPLEVRFAVIIFGAISLFFSVTGRGGTISHLTHLGGIVAGYLYLQLYPRIVAWWEHQEELKEERQVRRRSEEKLSRDKYFENEIDPLLKKIQESGMESLSEKEKKVLFEASKKYKNKFSDKFIHPHDFK